MEEIKIVLNAEGIQNELEDWKNQFHLYLDYDSEANFDGILCCTVIGTAVNIGMFLMQAYSLWGNKKISIRTSELSIDEITIRKVIEYLKSMENKEKEQSQDVCQ